jgi:hypothetical protein
VLKSLLPGLGVLSVAIEQSAIEIAKDSLRVSGGYL